MQSPPGFASVGSRLLLSCSYSDSEWPGEVSWVRGGRRVEGNWLLIERVSRDDEGRYTCVVDRAGRLLSADTVVRVQCMRLIFFTARRCASAVYAVVVCLSVTSRHCTKMAKRSITQTTPNDSQRSPRNSYGVTYNGGAKQMWGRFESAIFDQYLYISQNSTR